MYHVFKGKGDLVGCDISKHLAAAKLDKDGHGRTPTVDNVVVKVIS